MSNVKKQKSKLPSKPLFETPKDGDWISVSYDGHRNSWWGPLYYRAIFEDKERGKIEGACVLTETWTEPGKLSLLFGQVEFWSVWEGETSKEYQERKERIIADLQQKKAPIDPIDSFIGKNAIQGEWSKPKIGPAFKAVPIEGEWTHPKDEDMIEVHPWNYSEAIQGVYFSAADRIYSRNRTIERAILVGEGAGEVQYGDRFRYGVPKLPFAEWVRWRLIGDTVSQWHPGPHFENWEREEKIRMLREKEERNTKAFRDWKEWLENELYKAKSTAECIVILREMLRSEETVPLPNRESYVTLLSNKLKHFEEVLIVEKSDPNSPSEEIPALKYPYLKEDLFKLFNHIEPGLIPETFYKRLSRWAENPDGLVVEGVPIEMIEIAGTSRISRKSFENVKEVVALRLKADEGFKSLN